MLLISNQNSELKKIYFIPLPKINGVQSFLFCMFTSAFLSNSNSTILFSPFNDAKN